MSLKYNKLWKLLIDKNMTKTDLRQLVGLSQGTLAKMSKGQNVNVSTLDRICIVLGCQLTDIVEFGASQNEEI